MKGRRVVVVRSVFTGGWMSDKVDQLPWGVAAKARAAMSHQQQMFQHAVKLGVPIAMGTDAGVEPHGLNAREFSLMTKYGMAPAEVLMAGTASGADLVGVADQIRTLDPGETGGDLAGGAQNHPPHA